MVSVRVSLRWNIHTDSSKQEFSFFFFELSFHNMHTSWLFFFSSELKKCDSFYCLLLLRAPGQLYINLCPFSSNSQVSASQRRWALLLTVEEIEALNNLDGSIRLLPVCPSLSSGTLSASPSLSLYCTLSSIKQMSDVALVWITDERV